MVRHPAVHGTTLVGCVWGKIPPVARGRLVRYDVHHAKERGAGKIVGHACSGALHACPVVGLANLCLLLRKHGSPHDAPLGTYREIPSFPLCYIKSSDISKALKSAARVHGAEFGIGSDDVSSGYLRSTSAMALFCGGIDSSRIRLLGTWQSCTMLQYLHFAVSSGHARPLHGHAPGGSC